VLAETDPARFFQNGDCHVIQTGISIAMPPPPPECENVKTKILVLYTPAVAAKETDIPGKAALAIDQINSINGNSGISHRVSLAGIEPFSFVESGHAGNDLNNLKADPDAQDLREFYEAEIVVLLTDHKYTALGSTKSQGGPKEDAYCLVTSIYATSDRRTFAHEVGHIFGGGHDDASGTARGRIFRTGTIIPPLFGKKRNTLMAQLYGGATTRIEHISNPSINFLGQPTGTSDRNNKAKITSMVNHVAAFYPDPSLPMSVTATNIGPGPCQTTGTATAVAKCGRAPYSYQWYTVDYATSSGWIPAGTGATIATSVPIGYGLSTKPYKVVVTDSWGFVTAESTTWAHTWCSDFVPVGGPEVGPMSGQVAVSQQDGIEIFPNPGRDKIVLQLSTSEADNIDVTIYDAAGRLQAVLYQGLLNKGENKLPIDISAYASGVYVIKAIGSSYNQSAKLTISK